ncbi:hypothetical protein A4U88_1802 [Serratia marcescens]|nr:hypothetical protein A4U88_1802 [Serratia marcescens]
MAEIAAITAMMMEITSKGMLPGLTPISARTRTPNPPRTRYRYRPTWPLKRWPAER